MVYQYRFFTVDFEGEPPLIGVIMALFNMGIFIVAAKRTPFGTFGGVLKSKSCTELAEHAAKASIRYSQLSTNLIGTVVFGNVLQVWMIFFLK